MEIKGEFLNCNLQRNQNHQCELVVLIFLQFKIGVIICPYILSTKNVKIFFIETSIVSPYPCSYLITLKYLASGWANTIAETDASGSIM